MASAMSARPTIADIARECGVSQSTVSRALRDHPSISEARKRSIRTAAENLGFESRISARTLRGEGSKLVACVVPSLSHPFMSCLIERLEAEGALQGYHLMVANSGGSPNAEKTIVKGLIALQVDGVFFIPSSFESSAFRLCGSVLPTVVVTLQSPEWPSIGTSHEEGGRLVAEHFMESGRTSCLLVGPHDDEKFRGFEAYLESRKVAGFRVERLVADGWDEGLTASVQANLLENYDARSIRRFDCIFGNNDLAALGALHALQDLGIAVPAGIAVCGFDDSPWARVSRPALSSVAQPVSLMVRSAFALLQRLMTGETIPPGERSYSLKPHLVVRDSTYLGK